MVMDRAPRSFLLPWPGDCVLEWDGTGEADKPRLKKMFAVERKKVGCLFRALAVDSQEGRKKEVDIMWFSLE